MKAKRLWIAVIALIALFAAAACAPTQDEKPTVTLSATELTVDLYGTATLTAEVQNTDSAVVWSSSKTDVVTVSAGVLTPVSEGTAVITATAGEASATCNVTVASSGETPVLTLDKSGNVTHKAGEQFQITPTVKYKNNTVEADSVEYKSSAEAVATVTGTGLVKCVGAGDAVITVNATYRNAKLSATVNLKVNPNITFYLSEDGVELATAAPEGTDFKTTATIVATASENGVDVDPSGIKWTTSDPGVATVSGGVITAVGAGEATITASFTAKNNKEYKAYVDVVVFMPTVKTDETPVFEVDILDDTSEYVPITFKELTFDPAKVLGVTDLTGGGEGTAIAFRAEGGKLQLRKSDIVTGSRTYAIAVNGLKFTVEVTAITKILTTKQDIENLNEYALRYAGTKIEDTSDVGGYFLLGADIDMEGAEIAGVGGYDGAYYNRFTGIFDGQGHTISNFFMTEDYGGFFSYMTETAVFKNVALVNYSIIYLDEETAANTEGGPRTGAVSTYCEGEIGNVFAYMSRFQDRGGAQGDAGAGLPPSSGITSLVSTEASIHDIFIVVGTMRGWSWFAGSIIGRVDAGGWINGNYPNVKNLYSVLLHSDDPGRSQCILSALGNNVAGRGTNPPGTNTLNFVTDSHILAEKFAWNSSETARNANVRSFHTYSQFADWQKNDNNYKGAFEDAVWAGESFTKATGSVNTFLLNELTLTADLQTVQPGTTVNLTTAHGYYPAMLSLKTQIDGVTLNAEEKTVTVARTVEPTEIVVVYSMNFNPEIRRELTITVEPRVITTQTVMEEVRIDLQNVEGGTVKLSLVSHGIGVDDVESVKDVTEIVDGVPVNFTAGANKLELVRADVIPGVRTWVVSTADCEYTFTNVVIVSRVLMTKDDILKLEEYARNYLGTPVNGEADVGGHFLLGADIDMGGAVIEGVGGWNKDHYFNRFTGIFDGKGHSISNFRIEKAYGGFFSYLTEMAIFRNVALLHVVFDAHGYSSREDYPNGAQLYGPRAGVVSTYCAGEISNVMIYAPWFGQANTGLSDYPNKLPGSSLITSEIANQAKIQNIFAIVKDHVGWTYFSGTVIGRVSASGWRNGDYPNVKNLYSVLLECNDVNEHRFVISAVGNSSDRGRGVNVPREGNINYFTDSHLLAEKFPNEASETVKNANVRSFFRQDLYETWREENEIQGFDPNVWDLSGTYPKLKK